MSVPALTTNNQSHISTESSNQNINVTKQGKAKASLIVTIETVQNISVHLFSESYGSQSHPSVLLIMGSGCQGLLWPNEFCESLANKGFFVIRYDHRDTGLSSYMESQYTIREMSEDAVAILDAYKVAQAHLVGFSMGGQIAQMIAGFHPKRTSTLTLISCSTTLNPFFNAVAGKFDSHDLSPPNQSYVDFLTQKPAPSDTLPSEKIDNFMKRWKLLNGEKSYDEAFFKQLAVRNFLYAKGNAYPNHSAAMRTSAKDHEEALKLIKTDTVIVVGTEEALFKEDHAQALQKVIANSKVLVVERMGHAIIPEFYQILISTIMRT